MILRSIACQLARMLPPYSDKLRQLEAAGTDPTTADTRSIWHWLFKQTLFRLSVDKPIYCVIDGVDEAESPELIMRFLSELHLTTIPLRVLVVSRQTQEISRAVQKLAKQVETESIQMDGTSDDLRTYIDHEMDIAGEAASRKEITNQLLERARGNFLWVHLAVQVINECHTKANLEKALDDLPTGMEALYDRMATSVQLQPNLGNRRLGLSVLGWAVCARRALSVEELADALDDNASPEIHRTIRELCGGFVVFDAKGRVAMIHQTAREYLIRDSERHRKPEQPLIIEANTTNDKLLLRCIQRLTDPALRGLITRDQPPPLLEYASTSWYQHLSSGSYSNPYIGGAVLKFLQGPQLLLWIQTAAKCKKLQTLVVASRYLTEVARKLRDLEVSTQTADIFERLAIDLVKVVGKFGPNLMRTPDAIHKLIPPFCPKDSFIYQQFGHKDAWALTVSGLTTTTWDDCLARFSLETEERASVIISAGSRIAVLANAGRIGSIVIYDAITFEEQRRITHPDRVLSIETNKLGNTILSYGYLTTRVWDMTTGHCIKVVKNPARQPRPQTISFVDKDTTVIVGGEDRCIRSFSLKDNFTDWELRAKITEEVAEGTIANLPVCSAISPDGTMIAFGYRGHPATVWELKPPRLVGLCNIALNKNDGTIQETMWGEVFGLAWHLSRL